MPGSHIILTMHTGLCGYEVAFAARFTLHDELRLSGASFRGCISMGEQAGTVYLTVPNQLERHAPVVGVA